MIYLLTLDFCACLLFASFLDGCARTPRFLFRLKSSFIVNVAFSLWAMNASKIQYSMSKVYGRNANLRS